MAEAMFKRQLRRKMSPEAEEPPKKKKKTSAESCRDYREKMKQDLNVYTAYRNYENVRVKNYIATISEEKKAQYREKTRLRVQKLRAKQKSGGKENKQTKIKTRREQEKQRVKWREQKRQQLFGETDEKRQRRNEKRREKYAEKKIITKGKPVETPTPMTSNKPSFQSYEALRKATYRASQSMPNSKEKKVEVLAKMVSCSTPKSKQMLKEKLCSPKSKKTLEFEKTAISAIKQKLKNLNKKRNKAALHQKRILVYSIVKKYKGIKQVRQELGVSYNLIKKINASNCEEDLLKRKTRKDATQENTKKDIVNFFKRSDMSRSLPDARSAKKEKGDIISRRVMERSMDSAHKAFREENPDIKISLPTFSTLRPKDVMPCTRNKRRDCLCEYCANVELKLEAMRNVSVRQGLGGELLRDKYEVSRKTLCEKGETGEYRRQCLERKCVDCGVNCGVILDILEPIRATETPISFHRWMIVDIGGKKRMTRVAKTVPGFTFIAELKEDLKPFAKHLFDASWQGRQYDRIAASPPEDSVVLCQDFAENFTLRYQDEAQGAHWGYTQVTLHATVASYQCRDDECTLSTPVTEALVFVSDDQKHDSHAVHHYDKLVYEHLNVRAGNKPFKNSVLFSDGAPTQYKNKSSFTDLSYTEEDFGIKGERHFFGSRHGKGPCDREFGTLKKAVGLAINNRKAELGTAKDFFIFCRDHYTKPKPTDEHSHYRRKFFFVSEDDVQPERARERQLDLKPIPQTRQQHCVRGVSPFIVTFRERSCFCDVCLTGAGNCLNTDITGQWKVTMMKKNMGQVQPPNVDAPQDYQPPNVDVPQDEHTAGPATEEPSTETAARNDDMPQDNQTPNGGAPQDEHTAGPATEEPSTETAARNDDMPQDNQTPHGGAPQDEHTAGPATEEPSTETAARNDDMPQDNQTPNGGAPQDEHTAGPATEEPSTETAARNDDMPQDNQTPHGGAPQDEHTAGPATEEPSTETAAHNANIPLVLPQNTEYPRVQDKDTAGPAIVQEISSELDNSTLVQEFAVIEFDADSTTTPGPQQQFDRISVGTYVAIQHGKDMLPAVITKMENDLFWIKYYRSVGKGKWTEQQKNFTAAKSDISAILQPPELVPESCSRFFFRFNDL